VYFCYEFWRKIVLKSATWNCLRHSACPRAMSRRARHVGRRRTPRACARRGRPATTGPKPSVVGTVHLRLVMHANGLGQCHAASPHSPTCERPPSIGRRPPRVANPLRAHAVATVANESSAKPPWSDAGLYKLPLPFLARARVALQSAAARH
jgi:hypothetical protein